MLIFEKVFGIISYFLAFYFEYISICLISRNKHKFAFYNICIITIISAINYGLTITGIVPLKMVFSFLSILLIARLCSKLDIKRTVLVSIMFYLIIMLVEYLCTIVLIDILKYNPQKFVVSVGIQKCIIGHIINVILIIFSSLKITRKLFDLLCVVTDKLGIRSNHVYILLTSIFIIQMMYAKNIIGKINMVYTILYIILLIVFISYILLSLYRNYYLKTFNELLLDKDKEMQKMLDEYIIFKHNIRNNLLAISSVGNKKVQGMINDYINGFDYNINIKNDIGSVPNGLKGIIYQKLIKRDKVSANIVVDNYIKTDPVNILSIKDYRKIVETIGIIIDNAIEAVSSKNSDYVYLYLDEDDDTYTIKCINTFTNPINLDSISNQGSTGKKNHAGVGIYYIKNRTKFTLKNRIINNKFCAEVIVKK